MTKLLDETSAAAVVVNAPAGYGKSLLVAEWLERAPNVAWFSATPAHADVAAVAVALADAVAAVVPGAGARLTQRVRVADEQLAKPLAELLAEDLEAWPDEARLVIDDYQELMESDAVEEFVDALLTLAPIRLVVTTRRRPSWASARRLLYGEILELGPDQLAMTAEEAAEAIGGRSPSEVEQLVRRANGWPALIGLAALAAAAEVPRARASDTLFRYFADEVLRQQPPEVQQFMLAAAVPEAIAPGVAAEVLGLTAADADAALRRLADEGLVGTGEGRRFHPLLREFLRRKLEVEEPVLAARVAEAAIAAARADGRWEEAFELAVDSGRIEVAGAIAAEAAPLLLAAGRVETVEKWLAACGAATLDQPALSLAQAEVLIQRGNAARALPLALHVAVRLPDDDPLTSRAWADAGLAGRLTWDDERAHEWHVQAHRTATNDDARARAVWGLIQTAARLELPELDEYVDELETYACDLNGKLRVATARYHSARLSDTLAGLGTEFHGLAAMAERGTDPLAVIYFLGTAAGRAILAGEYAEALRLADMGAATCDRFRVAYPLGLCVHMRAEAEIALGSVGSARETLAQLSTIMRRHVEGPSSLLVEDGLRLKLGLAEGRCEVPARLDASLDERMIGSWLASYRSTVAIVAAGAGDLARGREEAREAARLTGAVDVGFVCRFAELVCRAQEGEDVAADAVALVNDAARAAVPDAAALAVRAYPPLAGLVAGDEAASTLLRRLTAGEQLQGPRRHAPAAAAKVTGEIAALTPRELEVLGLLADGLSNADIAARLVISRGTVKVHVHHIFEKLGARNRTDAVVRARALVDTGG